MVGVTILVDFLKKHAKGCTKNDSSIIQIVAKHLLKGLRQDLTENFQILYFSFSLFIMIYIEVYNTMSKFDIWEKKKTF